MDSIFLLSIILLGNIQSGVAVYVLFTSCGKSVNVGESCTLTCNTGTTTDSAIIWLNGTSSTAIDSNDCTNKGGLPDNYTSSCPSPGVFELTITGAQYGRDSHAWSCSNFFGGTPSNTTNNNTFVSVPLRLPNVTEAKQTIECYVITSPPATLKLFDVTTEIETETNYTRTWDGLKTTLSAEINGSGSYFCCADNGNEKRCSNFTISDEVTTPPPQPTTPPPPDCECVIICIVLSVLEGIGCGCEVAAIVAIVIVYCMFQLITGTLIYELPGTPDRKKLKEKLQEGLKKLEVNHTIDQTGKLRITLKKAEFKEEELMRLILNLKSMEIIVGEKVFPAWAKYVILGAGLLGSLLGVIGIILQQVLCCLGECLALLILAIIAIVIGALVIIIWIAWIKTWIFYKRKKSRPEAGNSPIPLTRSQIHTTPSEKKTPRGEPPKKMLEQKVRSIDELKEIKKKPPPVFKGNGQSQNNPREPSPISQSDSVASSSDVAVHPGKTKVTPTNEPVRM